MFDPKWNEGILILKAFIAVILCFKSCLVATYFDYFHLWAFPIVLYVKTSFNNILFVNMFFIIQFQV